MNELMKKQLQPLRQDLTRLFSKYPVNLSRRMNFEQQLTDLFHQSFNQPIPSSLHDRFIHEKHILQSIYNQIKTNQLLLRRTANDQNTYYIGQLNEFEEKSKDFLKQSSCYMFVGQINETMTEQNHIKDIVLFIDNQLKLAFEQKLISKDHLTQLCTSKRTNLKLPHLYFLPETNDDIHMNVQPRFSSFKYSPIQRLAQYLEKLIQSLFDQVCRSTTVLNGIDFFDKFTFFWYQQTKAKKSIQFATFKIHDLYTNISHDELLQALNTLLVNPMIMGRHQHLSIDGILELTSIVLRNNYFIYQDSIYRFVRGCSLNLRLLKLLANIYLHQWQIPLCREIRLKDEFYVRFHDQAFMTWSNSVQDLQQIFNQLEQNLSNDIQMISFIGTDTHFLNCSIENINGRLYTRVYRDTNLQSFILPYFSSHPRLIYRQWYRFMMIRAAQYCDQLEDFQDERRYIEATFLANGYSLDFIEYLWRQFILRFGFSPLQLIYFDNYKYDTFRSEIRRRPSRYQNDSKQQSIEYELMKNEKLFRFYYLYDWGSRSEFQRKFYQLWTTIINEDPLFKNYGLKIILNSKHCYLSNTLVANPLSKKSIE